MKIFARILSFIFHPLLLPTFGTILIIIANPYWFMGFKNGSFSILAIIIPLTFGFPVITVLLMKALQFVDDLYLRDQKQRFIPFIAMMIYYIWTFMVLRSQQMPTPILWMMLGSCIAIILAFIVNIGMKISLHTLGMGCLVCVAANAVFISFSNITPIFLICILIAGLVGSARLYLQEHQPQEIYSGYLLGFVSMMIAGWFY